MTNDFLGRGWSFPPTFRREFLGVEMLEGEADMRSSIEIIHTTITGERVMLPTFGAILQPHVFDPMNPQGIALIEKIVHDALVYHEPRIIVKNIVTIPDRMNGRLNIDIRYTII